MHLKVNEKENYSIITNIAVQLILIGLDQFHVL